MTEQKDEQTPLEAEILREVAEEMQEEQLKRLWKKFSPYITGAIVLALLVTGGWELYNSYQKRLSLEESEQLQTALRLIESDDDKATGADMLKTLSENSTRGYRYIAAFHYADYLRMKGPEGYEDAIHVLERIIYDRGAPVPFRNLAFFDKILLQNENGSLDAEQTEEELKELAKRSVAWAPMAKEFMAELALSQGDVEQAKEHWQDILEMRGGVSEKKRQRIAGYISFVEGNEKTEK